LTKAVTIIALACLLIAGAAATSIIARDSVPAARSEVASTAVIHPVSNRETKKDRLALAAAVAPPSFEPSPAPLSSEPLRQAFAATTASDLAAAKVVSAFPAPLPPPKTKLAAKPPPQKSYALLSEAQIAGIKERLKLSSSQEYCWPAVEAALRAVARKIHATRKADPNAAGAPIDPEAEEVQQLKSAAMPLLLQLREDQKREVRALARLIGLEKVAAQI
jgi:hypothetical protein